MISYAEYISWPIEWSLLAFHLSVAIFIASQVLQKRVPYTTGFFKIYLVQSVVDIWNYLSVSSLYFLLSQLYLIVLTYRVHYFYV